MARKNPRTTHAHIMRDGAWAGTACGKGEADVQSGKAPVVARLKDCSCFPCATYLERTGDGPEALKSLLRL